MNELWVTFWRSMAVTSHFDLLKMRPKSAHSSSRFAISVSTVGDGPPKDMSSRYPKARGEVNLRRAGWSGRQNNKGPNGSPAVDRPLIELCICQILTETVPRKPGGNRAQSLASAYVSMEDSIRSRCRLLKALDKSSFTKTVFESRSARNLREA